MEGSVLQVGTGVRRALRRGRRAVATLGHELVELGLVLGLAQAVEEALEFLLLILEAAQRLLAILVEGAIAARREAATEATAEIAEGFRAFLLPAAETATRATEHPSTPYRKGQDRQTQRPPGH